MPSLPVGAVVGGRYEVRVLLAETQAHSLYLAANRESGRTEVLKVGFAPSCSEETLRSDIEKEAGLYRELPPSEWLIRAYAFFAATCASGERVYVLALEHAPDGSVGDWMEANRANRETRLAVGPGLFWRMCEAVLRLHELGILHGDVTPRNFLVSGPSLKIADLGSAVRLHGRGGTDGGGARGRSPSSTSGTPAYASPEARRARDGWVPRESYDIYPLGAILFEILSTDGRPLFLHPAIVRGGEARADALRRLLPDVSERLVGAIGCCLAEDPADRYQNVGELLDAIERGAADFGGSDETAELHHGTSSDITDLWSVAQAAFATKDLGSADEACSRLLAQLPGHEGATRLLGEIRDRFRRAQQLYEIADRDWRRCDLEAQLPLLQQASELYPGHPCGVRVLETAAAKVNRYREAMSACADAMRTGDRASALRAARLALEVSPGSGSAAAVVQHISARRPGR